VVLLVAAECCLLLLLVVGALLAVAASLLLGVAWMGVAARHQEEGLQGGKKHTRTQQQRGEHST
jgi:hypothetical protein